MTNFLEILTASDSDLVKLFYKVNVDTKSDFILRINNVATSLGLNHTQLICALAFNPNIENLTDIHSLLGFRSFKVLDYRNEELFTTDAYFQLAIDNILDLYSVILEDEDVVTKVRKLLPRRLEVIENKIEKKEEPNHVMSYRMEINSLYSLQIADKEFADMRLKLNIGQHRIYSGELKAIIEAGYYPANNLFFMDSLSPLEKKFLIDELDIPKEIIINRLQNQNITSEERNILEDCI